jgi:hypothetical protein
MKYVLSTLTVGIDAGKFAIESQNWDRLRENLGTYWLFYQPD